MRETIAGVNAMADSAEILFLSICFRVSIGGDEKHGFLSDNGFSSGRGYIVRKSICRKPNSYTSQCL